MKKIIIPVIAILVMGGLLLGLGRWTGSYAQWNARQEHLKTMKTLLPGSENFTLETVTGKNTNIRSVHRGETGFVVEVATQGYADEIVLLVGVSNEGKVTGLTIRDIHETYGLGNTALTDWEFLAQYLNTTGDAKVGQNVDAISGATVTSKAITRAVNAAVSTAVSYVTGNDVNTDTDADSGATSWEG